MHASDSMEDVSPDSPSLEAFRRYLPEWGCIPSPDSECATFHATLQLLALTIDHESTGCLIYLILSTIYILACILLYILVHYTIHAEKNLHRGSTGIVKEASQTTPILVGFGSSIFIDIILEISASRYVHLLILISSWFLHIIHLYLIHQLLAFNTADLHANSCVDT
jgi:hypothetical protein